MVSLAAIDLRERILGIRLSVEDTANSGHSDTRKRVDDFNCVVGGKYILWVFLLEASPVFIEVHGFVRYRL